MSTRLFADPKDRRYDTRFPRKSLGTPRLGRLSGKRLVFDRFSLSGKASINCDECRKTTKDNSTAFPHYLAN
jgi:hypothetical protein